MKKWIILIFFVFLISVLVYNFKKFNLANKFLAPLVLPLLSAGHSLGEGIRNFFSNYFILVDLKKENERLKEELLILKAKLAYYKERERLYKKLENFFKISSEIKYPKVAARIIYKPFDPYLGVIFIDKGSDDGISPQMPVLAAVREEAISLIGQVVEVYSSWSKVILLTNPSFAADVKVLTDNSTEDELNRGILRGKGEKYCSLEYLPLYTDIRKGNLVVTSGFDELFPPGLLIGRIVSIKRSKKEAGLFKIASVEPFVDIKKIDLVFVLIKAPKIKFD